MAKVNSPLLSGRARGQIMKSLVFFPWKSINAVRGYVVPADPNTAGQQAQRTKMANAVQEWHDQGYTAKDKTAWNKLASTLAQIMSGFNTMVQAHIKAYIDGGTWDVMNNAQEASPGATDVDVTVAAPAVGTPKATIYWGTSPTFMPNSEEVQASLGLWTFNPTGLVDGVTYYYTVISTEGTIYSRLGVYKYTHVAP